MVKFVHLQGEGKEAKKEQKNNRIAIDVVVCDSHFSLINLRYNN